MAHAGERRLCPAGSGDVVVAPCGGDCAVLLGPRPCAPVASSAVQLARRANRDLRGRQGHRAAGARWGHPSHIRRSPNRKSPHRESL